MNPKFREQGHGKEKSPIKKKKKKKKACNEMC